MTQKKTLTYTFHYWGAFVLDPHQKYSRNAKLFMDLSIIRKTKNLC
jgi:hypothetical protein